MNKFLPDFLNSFGSQHTKSVFQAAEILKKEVEKRVIYSSFMEMSENAASFVWLLLHYSAVLNQCKQMISNISNQIADCRNREESDALINGEEKQPYEEQYYSYHIGILKNKLKEIADYVAEVKTKLSAFNAFLFHHGTVVIPVGDEPSLPAAETFGSFHRKIVSQATEIEELLKNIGSD